MEQRYIVSIGSEKGDLYPAYRHGFDQHARYRVASYVTTDLEDAKIAADRFYSGRKARLGNARIGVATLENGRPGILVYVCSDEKPDFLKKHPE